MSKPKVEQPELVPATTTKPERSEKETKPATACSAMTMLEAVTKSGGNTEAIEIIAKLYREERDDHRRMEFDAAMSEAQAEMVRVAPDSDNPQTHSRYASYAALDRKIRPIYTKYGFGLSFNTVPTDKVEWVRVTCRVSHKSGWGQDYAVDMPADGKGARGGDVMSKTHAVGSATSYGMRYLLRMIFNIAVGKDDDGNGASGAPVINEEQAANLRELCEATGRKIETVIAMAGVSDLAHYPLAAYEEATRILAKAANSKRD